MTLTFQQLGLKEPFVSALKVEAITQPTPIQEKVIPLVLKHCDVVGQSETGTGKTLAYLLPIIQKVDEEKKEVQALVLTPTHELAIQVQRQIERIVNNSKAKVTATVLIGDVNIKRQIEKLKEKPHIIVGSAGRILELIQKRKISAQTIRTIVLDEADRLLDPMNAATVKAVIKTTLKDRQLLLFSATMPPAVVEQASDLLKEPEIVRVTEQLQVASDIEHQYFVAEQRDKIEVVRKLIRIINPLRALIFINKSDEIEITVEKLKFHGLEAEGIHGSSIKADRRKVLEDFRTGKLHLLVASDLAARGLDIKGISHIFNLDMPEDLNLYLHRVGRTGRAGEKGTAISIVTPHESVTLKKIERRFKLTIKHKDMYKGTIVDPRYKVGVKKRHAKHPPSKNSLTQPKKG